MIKFPGSPPRTGPLCLPDGWPTGFFLRPFCQAGPVGVEWRAFWGAQRTLCPPRPSPLPQGIRALPWQSLTAPGYSSWRGPRGPCL